MPIISGGGSSGGGGSSKLAVLYDNTLSGSAASWDTGANGIAQTNKDLLIVTSIRTTEAMVLREDGAVQFNNDTTAGNYKSHRLQLQGTTITGLTTFGNTGLNCLMCAGTSSDANTFGTSYVYVPNYTSSTTHNTMGIQAGVGTAGTAGNWWVYLTNCRYNVAAAITRVVVVPNTGGGGQLGTGSRLTIYGLG